MNELVVVDASLAVKWLVNEVHSGKAFALAQSWARAGVQPVAPYLMPVEVANALFRRLLRGDIAPGVATRLLAELMATGIELRKPAGLHSRAVELATQLHQGAVYDAIYRESLCGIADGSESKDGRAHDGKKRARDCD